MRKSSLSVSAAKRSPDRGWGPWLARILAGVVLAVTGGACTTVDGDDDDGGGGDGMTPDAAGPVCGNRVCEGNEVVTCAADCLPPPPPPCGNNVCDANETTATCPADCPPPPPPPARLVVRNTSSFDVYRLYVWSCNSSVWGPNWLGPNILFPNYQFTLSNIPPGCYNFRAEYSASWYWERLGNTLGSGQTFTWTLL